MSLQVVVGGQFGSEAKGAVTAAICNSEVRRTPYVTVVRVGGPNAGHSAVDHQGRLWALRQIPVGMVVDPNIAGVIADGSEIDVQVLADEVVRLEDAGHQIRHRLLVSDEATIINTAHKLIEGGLVGAIGSTGKGIGAARADRAMRAAPRVADVGPMFRDLGFRVVHGPELCRDLNAKVRSSRHVVVLEGTQGYGLGLHAGHYPQCTSSDCRAVDFLSMAGVNPWWLDDSQMAVHVVVRPYPIRVAGNSGPLKDETSWEALGLKPELTTVTKKVRRVGLWNPELVKAAVAANSPNVILAVSMVDQVPGLVEGDELTDKGADWLNNLEEEVGAQIGWYGTGPTLNDWNLY